MNGVTSDQEKKEFKDVYDNLISRLDIANNKLQLIQVDVDEFKGQLTTLYDSSISIYSFVNEYDYSPEIRYNGFRSFLKMTKSYFNSLITLLPEVLISSSQSKLNSEPIKSFILFINLLLHQVQALHLISKLKQTNSTDEITNDKDDTLAVELQILSHQMKLGEKEIEPFYMPTVAGFWLPRSLQEMFRKGTMRATALVFYPITQSIPAMFNKKKLSKLLADKAINGSINEVSKESKLWSLAANSKTCNDVEIITYFLSERQNKWIIDNENKKIILNSNSSNLKKDNKSIRLVIVKPKVRTTSQIIFHIHGGAWVMGSPEVYINSINNWVKATGATVVSIDYSLAPQAAYPIAIQEITDTYVWLSDSITNNKANLPLGFVPSDILITGDSAGGNLSMTLTIVLAEIRKISPQALNLPRAIVAVYPAASPGLPYTWPSSVLLDVILNGPMRLKIASVYLLTDVVDPKVSFLNGKNNPWFKDETKTRDIYVRVNGNKKSDPIFHVFTYDSFDVMKDVPLYIQAAEFDPLLDDAITLAKLWKGKVTLDVMPDVVHGFSVFRDKSAECRKADDLVIQRMKEALQ